MRALLVLAALCGTAHAEGEQALSLSFGPAWFSAPGTAPNGGTPPSVSPDIGGALAVSYERMIGTDFGLRGELAGGIFYGGAQMKESNTSFAGLGDAGVVFRFDILKVVPYAYAGLGAVMSGGGPIDRGADFVLVVGGGVDWLKSRDRSWGGEVRLASFGGDVTVFTIGARASVRWGYF
ncbi:MAG TPA: hypothetical protein VGM88_33550 [Kofleriaceae bacterium]